jgi:hypothetical protein
MIQAPELLARLLFALIEWRQHFQVQLHLKQVGQGQYYKTFGHFYV